MISTALSVLETEEQRSELSQIYEHNAKKLYFIAYQRLRNSQDSEDAIQEAFLRIAKKPDKFFSLSEEERMYYICVIVRNVSIDIFNKNSKYKAEEIPEDYVYQSDFEPLENSFLAKISHEELLDFIDNLPGFQRNVLILNCLLKLSIAETAETLNVSKSLVSQKLYSARKSIKIFVERKSYE